MTMHSLLAGKLGPISKTLFSLVPLALVRKPSRTGPLSPSKIVLDCLTREPRLQKVYCFPFLGADGSDLFRHSPAFPRILDASITLLTVNFELQIGDITSFNSDIRYLRPVYFT
jgi:hypothetical protein